MNGILSHKVAMSKSLNFTETFTRTDAELKAFGNNFEIMKNSLQAYNISPTHILFNSFAWDIRAEYLGYCQYNVHNASTFADLQHINCLCNAVKGNKLDCKYSSTELFQNTEVPWCSQSSQKVWETTFIQVLQRFTAVFPKAIIFLRTQTPTSQTVFGSVFCQNNRNTFIRRQVLSKVVPNLKLLDFDALFRDQGSKLCFIF